MLETIGPVINLANYGEILKSTLRVIVNTVCSSSNITDIVPYGSAECRLKLYQVLVSIVQTPHKGYAPPTQCAVNLLNIGTKDRDKMVNVFACYIHYILNVKILFYERLSNKNKITSYT